MAEEEEYLQLNDLKISLDQDALLDGESDFSLCLWLYLSSSIPTSSIIIRQSHHEKEGEAPFLTLDERNKLCLFPLMFLHKESSSRDNSSVWLDIPHICTEIDCAREKWVHIGCEIAANRIRLHIDGTLVRETPLSPLSNDNNYQENLKKVVLLGGDGNNVNLQGYVYDFRVLPISASTKDHFIKNPPVKLTLYDSCISDGLEEGEDGAWSIIGGKGPDRRNFSMEVVLLDALGRIVHKEMKIFASLVYADNISPVEKTKDNIDAPLLSCDRFECPSDDKPVTLLRGRATFKLKISQLSSKCDGRLFCVYFRTKMSQRYPFLETYSCPIRSVSRSKVIRPATERRPISASPYLVATHSSRDHHIPHAIQHSNGGCPFQASNVSELKCNPSANRFKSSQDKKLGVIDANGISKQDHSAPKRSTERKSSSPEGTITDPSDSESTETRRVHAVTSISDRTIFRYCLEGIHEHTIMLKDIANFASNEDMIFFAKQVSLYAGCTHHGYQIIMSKQLIQEGTNAWYLISGNNPRVFWNQAVPEINRRFMKISHSTTRSLSGKDLDVLREIAGCGEEICRENFDKLWYWLYPVAFTLSKKIIHDLWECTNPLWIEGLITSEEAEHSLNGSRGLQKPGSFVLRFPTSRSWPHPDAGSLVVTYVGSDYVLHHKLLSLDLSSDDNGEGNSKPLQMLLSEEPELSQLSRVIRHGSLCSGLENKV